MKVIVTVVEKIISEAHIDIPDGLNKYAIRQHIVDTQLKLCHKLKSSKSSNR